jgi:EAL domain-containing protein (putative c-di-GMP-specific phosphodiesterase class I)
MRCWYLECVLNENEPVQRFSLSRFPVTVGREAHLSVTLPESSISRRHSRIDLRRDRLWVVDLGSRNGTFVNRRRIHEATPVQHGDILHMGSVEMRLILTETEDLVDPDDDDGTMTIDVNLSGHFPAGVRELEELIAKEMVSPAFQPIVSGEPTDVIGYESLGRGKSPAVSEDPQVLFRIAESVGLEVRLSELMREKGIARMAECGLQQTLFVNVHPAELREVRGLLRSLRDARKRFPSVRLVVEISERAITDLETIRVLKDELHAMEMQLAFDDFGVGQSRLIELIEATPDIIKFDAALIRHGGREAFSRTDLVRQLHRLSKSLGIRTVAEGVDRQEEFRVCRGIGFDYYQGYLFGAPCFCSNPPL